MKIRALCVMALLVCVNLVTAQEKNCRLTLKGLLIDSDTRQPVSAALLRIGSSNSAVSDEHGHFKLMSVCPGPVVLNVSASGYKIQSKPLILGADSIVTIELKTTNISLQQVHIKGRKRAEEGNKTTAILGDEKLQRSRGANLAETLKELSGVNVLQTGPTIGKPVIQGLHSNRILILNNGIRQEGQQWGTEHAPEIDPFVANQITLIKGADGVRYGPEAMAGVVLIEPEALVKRDHIGGVINISSASNSRSGSISGRLEGSLKQLPGFNWRFQGSAKRAGNSKTAQYFLDNTGLTEASFSGNLGYSKPGFNTELYFSRYTTEIGIFKGAHIGNMGDLRARLEAGSPFETGGFSYSIDVPRQDVAHNLLKAEAHVDIGNNAHLDLRYGLQQNKRREYDIRRGGRSGIPSLDLSQSSQTIDMALERLYESGWKHTVGLNALIQVNNNIPGTLAIPLIPNYDTYNAGVYYISRYMKPAYEIEAGIRYDHKYLDALGYNIQGTLYGDSRNFNNISATLGAVVRLSNILALRSNLGSAWRPPSVNELYSNGLHHGSASVEKGNVNLKSEHGYKLISSANLSTEKLSLEASVFINYIYKYIFLEPSNELYESIRGVFPTFNYKQTDATFAGADLTFSYDLAPFLHYDLKASAVRANDIASNTYLPGIPADRIENSIGYHSSVSEHNKPTAYLTLSHLFVAKQNRYEQGTDYAPAPAAYQLLNLTAGFSFGWERKRLSLNASINNITNSLYKDYMNRFRYFAHERGRDISLRVEFKF